MLTNKKPHSNRSKLQIGKKKFRKIIGPDRAAGNLRNFYGRILEIDCADLVHSYVQANTTVEQKQS